MTTSLPIHIDPDAELLSADDADLAALVHEDLRAFLAGGCVFSADADLAVYQHALSLCLRLRERLADPVPPPSALAVASQHEFDALCLARLVSRLRGALRMALGDPALGSLDPGVRAAIETALQ